MTDREEREQVLETLTNMRDWMEAARQIRSTPARINALNYAISSIKTDLKYDLLYEDNQIDDADKMIAEDNSCEPNNSENPTSSTTKNDLAVDCISRKAALDITWHDPSYSDPLNVLTEVRDKIRELPSVTPQEPDQYKSFCEFVASEIFSENWEYNKDSFAEIACRKLAKLGIVRKNGDTWELVEPQEGEVQE